MPSSLPSFFLSLCTTLFAFVPWVPSGTALVLSLVGCFLFLPVGCPLKNTPVSPLTPPILYDIILISK